MEPITSNVDTASRVPVLVSPPLVRVKRERSEDEEEDDEARRVNQRTGEVSAPHQQQEEKSMETLILDDLYNADEEVLTRALESIGNLLRLKNGEEGGVRTMRQEEFLQLGGHAAIVRVMNANLPSALIQKNGACILLSFCLYNDRAREAVGKVRGIQAVVEAMKAHSLERGVIHNGIGALINFTAANEVNATLLVTKLKAVPFIVERANHFSGDEMVTTAFVGLIKVLTGFAPLRKAILAANAGPALFNAINNFEGNNQLQSMSRKAITNLVKSE